MFGGNKGDVSLTIHGGGFADGTSVKLTRAGAQDIIMPDSVMSIIDGSRIEGMLDLRMKDTGYYNVVVTVPGDTVMIIQNGFHVKTGKGVNVWAQLSGFNAIRPNVWQTFSVAYGNSGDVDARGVPLFIAIPKTAQFKLQDSLLIAINDSTFRFVDTVYHAIRLDTLFDEPFDCKVYCLIIGNIPPAASGVLTFSLKSTNTVKIRIWTNPPLYSSPMNVKIATCFGDILTFVGGLTFLKNPVHGCIYDMVRAAVDPVIKIAIGGSMKNYVGPSGISGGVGVVSDYIQTGLMAMGGCVVGLFTMVEKLDELYKIAWESANHTRNLTSSFLSCAEIFDEENNQGKDVAVIASLDPNDKLGPAGFGSLHYLNAATPISYNIRFENVDTATTAANEVIVIDTLDTNVYDIGTFRLRSMYFGKKNIVIPAGRTSYNTKVDIRPAVNLIVDVDGHLDTLTGVVKWRFTGLDPQTMTVSQNPFLGFLPPNDSVPQGEGGVFYTIRLKPNLPNGTQVKNKAYIYFDGNAPIVTPDWQNQLDNFLPHSHVNSLPPISPDSFQVSWSGTDTGSGLLHYNIHVSENGKPYRTWLHHTADTISWFKGLQDSTYSFYAVAQDTAGNVEQKPLVADATTNVGISIPLPLQLSSFTAQKAGSRNRIDWELAGATAELSFELEQSANGYTYRVISSLTSRSGQLTYTVYDGKPDIGNNYYRLKIKELGGRHSYGPVAVVRNTSITKNVTVAPVPASQMVVVSNMDALLNGTPAVISDMDGREVYRFQLQPIVTVRMNEWPSGIYYLRLSSGEVMRIVKH